MGKQRNCTRRQDTVGEMCIIVIINCYATIMWICCCRGGFVWQTLCSQVFIGQARCIFKFIYLEPLEWCSHRAQSLCVTELRWSGISSFFAEVTPYVWIHIIIELLSFILLQSLCVTEFMILSVNTIGQMLIKLSLFILVGSHSVWLDLHWSKISSFICWSHSVWLDTCRLCDIIVHTNWSHGLPTTMMELLLIGSYCIYNDDTHVWILVWSHDDHTIITVWNNIIYQQTISHINNDYVLLMPPYGTMIIIHIYFKHFLMLLYPDDAALHWSVIIVLMFIVLLFIVLLNGLFLRTASCSDCVACSLALHRGNARRSSTTSRNISAFVYCIVVF